MDSNRVPTRAVWNVYRIGEFAIRDIIISLNVSYEALHYVRKVYAKTGEIPHWWQKAIWLMAYDQRSIRYASYSVDLSSCSVRYVRKEILRLGTSDFAILFGVKEQKVFSLEFREKVGEKHGHLMNVLLKLLSAPESRTFTIRRLLHLARFEAQTPNEHKAVSRLRERLIPKVST